MRLGVFGNVLEGATRRPRRRVHNSTLISPTMADALKAEGNKAFSAKDYDRAIDLFSKALDLDQSNFVIWSNRSAAKAGKRDWDGALADADQVRIPLPWHVVHNRAETSPCVGLAVHQGESNLGKGLRAQRRCIARPATLCRSHRRVRAWPQDRGQPCVTQGVGRSQGR
jgi:tetratricopeptide (TPR) repeat protein